MSDEITTLARALKRRINEELEMLNIRRQKLHADFEELEFQRARFYDEQNTFFEMQNKVKVQKILLNVGGTLFTTSRDTICSDEDSLLAKMFQNGVYTEDEVFIDRDGTHFRLVLNFLRDGGLPLPKDNSTKAELLEEAKHYNITGLIELLESQEERKVEFHSLQVNVHDAPPTRERSPARTPIYVKLRFDPRHSHPDIAFSDVLSSARVNDCMKAHRHILGDQCYKYGVHSWRCEISGLEGRQWIMIGVSMKRVFELGTSYSDSFTYGISSARQKYFGGAFTRGETSEIYAESLETIITMDIQLDCERGCLNYRMPFSSWNYKMDGLPTNTDCINDEDEVEWYPYFNLYTCDTQLKIESILNNKVRTDDSKD